VTDEVTSVLAVATERSGWFRRDLVGRLRSQSGLPVDDVVSESLVESGV
jgi:hypothetical protein